MAKKKAVVSSGNTCGCSGPCNKCKGFSLLIVGILVWLVASGKWAIDWWTFLAYILILKGLVLAFVPNKCPNCGSC